MTPEEFLEKLTALTKEGGLYVTAGDDGQLLLCPATEPWCYQPVADIMWNHAEQVYETMDSYIDRGRRETRLGKLGFAHSVG